MLKKILCTFLVLGLVAGSLSTQAAAQAKPSGDATATPEAQARRIYQAIRDQDYKALFYLMAFAPKAKETLTTAEAFAIDFKSGYDASFKTPEDHERTDKILHSISDIMIGEPVVTGNKAAIPTSAKITGNGVTLTFRGQANLINDGGVWKLDLTFTDDSEKATAQRVSEIFGQPEIKKAPGRPAA